jgi:galactokinase
MKNIEQALIQQFNKIFGEGDKIQTYFLPISSHKTKEANSGIYALVRMRSDRELHFYSENFPEFGILSSLDELTPDEASGWANYSKKAMWEFEQKGHTIATGFDIYIYATLTENAEMSFTTALETITAYFLTNLY